MVNQKKKGPVKVRFYRFRNRLKDLTAGIGGGSGGGISAEALAKAESALEDLSEDYPDWVSGLISKLSEQHSRCVDTPENRRAYFEEINIMAHDMKGQGGTFGYPLITDFADSLFKISENKDNIQDAHINIIKSHIDSMRAVISGRVSGDGGDIGKALRDELNKAIEKNLTA